MAGIPQALAFFPGIQQMESWSYTRTLGIAPNVFTMSVPPQVTWPEEGGTIRMSCDGVTIDMSRCKVDQATYQGRTVSVTVLDRRYMWKWGWISGRYNVRKPDGTVREETKKTMQELATLCLDAMKEQGYDVSQLPNGIEPEIEWDFDTPAEMLAQLCDMVGCAVALGIDDVVRIVVLGDGQDLTTSYFVNGGVTINPAEMPDRIAAVCSHVRFQMDLELEAMAMETVGSNEYKKLDDVSYKPPGSWKFEQLPWLPKSIYDNPSVVAAAEGSVLKAFRVKVPFDLPKVDERAPDKIESNFQFDVLDEQLILADTGSANEFARTTAPSIKGAYYDYSYDNKNNVTKLEPGLQPLAQVNRNFQVIVEEKTGAKIVLFDEPIFMNTEYTESQSTPTKVASGPPTLRLQVSILVRLKDTRGYIRYVRERQTGGNLDTPTQYLDREDILACVLAKYSGSYALNGFDTNRASADREADYSIDAALREYQFETPMSITYPGIQAINVDGAVRQVTWSGGTDTPPTTQVFRNNEKAVRTIPYKEMRRLQRQAADQKKAKKQIANPRLSKVPAITVTQPFI